MSDGYRPSLWQAVFLVAVACASLLLTSQFDDFVFGVGVFLAVASVILSICVIVWITQRESKEYYETISRVADSLKDLDPSRWQALGIRFPRLRVRWNSLPLTFIEDTDILQEDFIRFMGDSTKYQISPRRNWGNGVNGRKWETIFEWLKAEQLVWEDSAAGNHSWRWRGDAYYALMRYIPVGGPKAQLKQAGEEIEVPGFDEDIAPGAPTTGY